ncbi:uncharacterized protein LOC101672284 isoform X1 [Mustela putorius furo]|uniref:Uncharacterized protein LOC101672284 isoform X1 n=1 Tax=Mustela putorius furo TaxID=9669 RepID=A0A8U0TBZ9_MUSPF|nr:uncharacterized protein LOC101672284 isoform X1 [Mustela putorius furo]
MTRGGLGELAAVGCGAGAGAGPGGARGHRGKKRVGEGTSCSRSGAETRPRRLGLGSGVCRIGTVRGAGQERWGPGALAGACWQVVPQEKLIAGTKGMQDARLPLKSCSNLSLNQPLPHFNSAGRSLLYYPSTQEEDSFSLPNYSPAKEKLSSLFSLSSNGLWSKALAPNFPFPPYNVSLLCSLDQPVALPWLSCPNCNFSAISE